MQCTRTTKCSAMLHACCIQCAHEERHVFNCVQGILGAYQFTVSQVQLYGPTNFSSFMDRAISMASQPTTQQNQGYLILLVITVSDAE